MPRSYAILDVFTARPFAGNPLAVVFDSQGLTSADMQTIAREFNLSETVFILPETAAGHRADIRIFTPAAELPFAGHPTVGTAVVLAARDGLAPGESIDIVLGLKAGAVPCTVTAAADGTLTATLAAPRMPQELGPAPDIATLAEALGLKAEHIRNDAHRPRRFGAPVSFCFVPLAGNRLIERIAVDATRINHALGALHDTHPAIFAYAMGGLDGGDVRARMFAPALGVIEDPATGSAAVAFVGALHAAEPMDNGERTVVIEQGDDLGRPSRLTVRYTVERGGISAISLSGSAVIMADGRLFHTR